MWGGFALEAGLEGGEAGELGAEAALLAGGEGGVEALAEVVDALVAEEDGVAETGEDVLGGEAGEALAGAQEVELAGAVDAAFERLHTLFDAVLGGGDELGGGGRRGGAEVGDVIGDGVVDFVADGGDDGEMAGGDGACEALVVEAGKVFKRAAAAGDEDEVDAGDLGGWMIVALVEEADAADDGGGASRALHGGGKDEEVETGMAAADNVDDVADGGAVGAGDDADTVGKGGEGLLGAVEEAFAAEAVAELLEGELEGAGAAGAEGFGDELELAARLVGDGDAAADLDGEAVFGLEGEELGLGAEEDDGELGVAVLEGEVDVAGGGGAAVGDFAFDVEQAGVEVLDVAAELGDELADGVEGGLGFGGGWRFGCERDGGEVEGELGEGSGGFATLFLLEGEEGRDGGFGGHRWFEFIWTGVRLRSSCGCGRRTEPQRLKPVFSTAWDKPRLKPWLTWKFDERKFGKEFPESTVRLSNLGHAELISQAGLSMSPAVRRRSEGWQGLVTMETGLRKGAGAFADTGERGIKAGKDEDGAGGELAGEVLHEVDAVAAGHVDVAEEEIGGEEGGGVEGLVGVVGGGDGKAVTLENEAEGAGYEGFVVDYEDARHGDVLGEEEVDVRAEAGRSIEALRKAGVKLRFAMAGDCSS